MFGRDVLVFAEPTRYLLAPRWSVVLALTTSAGYRLTGSRDSEQGAERPAEFSKPSHSCWHFFASAMDMGRERRFASERPGGPGAMFPRLLPVRDRTLGWRCRTGIAIRDARRHLHGWNR